MKRIKKDLLNIKYTKQVLYFVYDFRAVSILRYGLGA